MDLERGVNVSVTHSTESIVPLCLFDMIFPSQALVPPTTCIKVLGYWTKIIMIIIMSILFLATANKLTCQNQ